MPLKLYTDTHISKQVAVQLRSKSVDIIRCEDVGMASASDEAHLEFAASEGRVVITHDDDFLALHANWQAAGKTHAAIIFVQPRLRGKANIGHLVNELLFYHLAVQESAASLDDVQNQRIFIG